MKNVLLFGATGNLGGLIAREILKRGAMLRAVVRPGSRTKLDPEIAAAAQLTDDEAEAFTGIDAVVSAVQGGPETIVDEQLRWLAAARRAGVKRFIPSDYSFDFLNLADGENLNSDWRRELARRAAEQAGEVEVVHVMNGCFLDHRVLFGFLGAIDLDKKEANLWGEGREKMDFTTYADTAAYTAEAALAEGPIGRKFQVAGDTLDFHELVAEVEAGTGIRLTVKRLGTLADLDAAIARAQSEQPANPYEWLPMMYWRGMLNGKGRLRELRNHQYPEISPTRVREYLAAR